MTEDALVAAMRSRGAALVAEAERPVAAHFGDAVAEYAAMRDAAAVVELPWIERLRATGADRIGFLQGMLSNDVVKLAPGSGCRALLLSEQGKVVGDLVVLAGEDVIALDGVGAASTVRTALERFVVADDVDLVPAAPGYAFALLGPDASDVLARLGLSAPNDPCAHAPAAIADGEPHVVRMSMPGAGGFLCRIPSAGAAVWWDRCVAAGGRPAGTDAFEVLRIEGGVPRHGRDVLVDTLALEAPYEAAISFRKGCYLGQEVMERVTARGHVNRRLVGIEVEGESESVPSPGARLFVGDREVGWVTSAGRSWRLGRTIGLAYVRRGHFEPGSELALGVSGGSAVIVRALPFPA
ncbi:MAG: aminomethyl transferase family protein [Deltaproteobacteria bacterium]|nr:aminomethyl transferase family protein [Deltaproteobacteria bacterium]